MLAAMIGGSSLTKRRGTLGFEDTVAASVDPVTVLGSLG